MTSLFEDVQAGFQKVPGFDVGIPRLQGLLEQAIKETSPKTLGGMAVNAQVFSDFVRDDKAHSLDILDQLVGIFLNDGEGLFLIGILDLKGQLVGNAVLCQLGQNHLCPVVDTEGVQKELAVFCRKSSDGGQFFRFSQDLVNGIFAIEFDNFFSRLATDTFKMLTGKILNQASRSGLAALIAADLQLLAVFGMGHQLTVKPIFFPFDDIRNGPCYDDFIVLKISIGFVNFQQQYFVKISRILENNPINGSRKIEFVHGFLCKKGVGVRIFSNPIPLPCFLK